MFRRTRRNKNKEVHAELNITAFMNLMVVLIPFLLITAVFSQVTILKLNLPAGDQSEQQLDDTLPMQLEVIIRKNKLVLAERNSGVISEFSLDELVVEQTATNKAVDNENAADITLTPFELLNQKLQLLKARASDATTITILAEPDTAYDLIIQTMDAVRMIVPEEGSDELPGELFPDVSIGSAPEVSQ
ncbi:MAG: biopolymer transporter ExbD [Gammaproteobacteria bacterium]|nr:biopolymer transporter ExbD [Gammaproteobacteria bacterium]